MSRRLRLGALALAVAVALAGCKKKKQAGPSQRLPPSSAPSVSGAPGGAAPGASLKRWPAGDLLASDVKFIHALYFAPKAKVDPVKALASCKLSTKPMCSRRYHTTSPKATKSPPKITAICCLCVTPTALAPPVVV